MSLFFSLFFFFTFSTITTILSTQTNIHALTVYHGQETPSNSIDEFNSDLYPDGPLSYFMQSLTKSEFYGKWHKWNSLYKWYMIPFDGFSLFPFFLTNTHTTYVKNSILKLCIFSDTETDASSSCLKFLDLLSLINDQGTFDQQDMTVKIYNVITQIDDPTYPTSLSEGCIVNATLRFVNKANNKPFKPEYNLETDAENIAAALWIQSSDCSLNLTTRITFLKHSLALIYILEYFMDIVLLSFTLQLLTSHWISECLLTDYQRISLGKLLIIHTFDFYVAFEYWLGYISALRSTKVVAAPSIMMILALMSSTIHAVAKRQKNIDLLEYSTIKRLNYSLWLLISIIAISASLLLKEHRAILMLGCLHEVPQIIQNYLTETKHSWQIPIFLFLSLPKFVYIGWTLAFSDVILGYSCGITFYVFVGLLFIQVLILIIQMKRPKILTKVKSLYKFLSESMMQNSNEICSICLEAPTENVSDSKEGFLHSRRQDKTIILTPCNHQFHLRCLENWTNQKLSCPYCRCTIPSLS